MCEYCKSEEPKGIFKDPYNVLMIQGNELYFLSQEGEDDYELSGKINYCPMCGRKLKEEKKMRLFKVKAGVRYYEDGKVNGEDDITYEEQKAGKQPKVPCVQRINDEWVWCIDIDADTGLILNWEKGNTADVHYKVCDCCEVDVIVDGNKIFDNEKACCGYVPGCLCPSGEGWGDYMIMHIDENGQIADWDIKKVNRYIDGD